jgi:hypothetical protein
MEIGQYCLILSSSGTLGISERTPKLRREMTTKHRAKTFKICRIKGLRRCQKDLKKETGKPSGPGAVSVLVSFKTASRSSSRKDHSSRSLSSEEAHCPSGQML